MRLSPRSPLRFLLALAWLGAALGAAAAPVDPARWRSQSGTLFTHYSSPDSTSGNAMAQDGSGFLWLGTQAGLVRWDGYFFRKFAADPRTPGALADSYVLAVHADDRGRLWVGTSAGGLARYDPTRDTFVAYPVVLGGVEVRSVHAITGDGRGGLWVGTAEGLAHLDAHDVVAPAESDEARRSLPEGGIDVLLTDRSGALWAGTPHGLFRRASGTLAFVPVQLARAGDAVPVTCLFEDARGRVWVGTRGEGAVVANPDGRAARAVLDGDSRTALGSDTVLGIVEAAQGEVWLGTYGGGIVAVGADGATRRIRHRAGLPTSLADDDVTTLFRDRSGLVWVGSVSALSRHDPQQRAVVAVLGEGDRPDTFRNGNTTFVLVRPDGRVWLGIGSDGIEIVDPVRGRVGQMRADGDHPRTALPKARVLSMVAGPHDEVYIGTRNGMYLADATGTAVTRLDIPGRAPTETVWSLCVDGGVLWLGGLDGLWALDASDPRRVRVLRHETAAGLGGARLMALLRGSGNDLWVGTEHGLVLVDTAGGAPRPVGGTKADPARFPVGMVSSFLKDSRGRLWLSSYGDGVWLMQARDGGGGEPRFRRLGVRDGLPDPGVDKVLEDRDGRIWASTDDGLAFIDPQTLSIRSLRRPEGVDILAYWTNAGDVTPAGELLFGGQGGMSVVRPGLLTTWLFRPPLVVTDAHVGATPVPVGRLDPSVGPVRPLEVPRGSRGLGLEFAALDFSAPERNRYAYRLRGFDADWIATDSAHRWASYTNLPPGDFTLEIRGTNRDGVWSEPPLALPIHVQPAWFQTVAFRGFAAVLALLLVATLVQARTLFLRRRQRELEALVGLRTADLEQRSAELRESQRQLEKIAYADPLTGLPNRRGFTDALRHQVAQALRGGPAFALLLIDLDGFKAVNDTHGHDAGDALLVGSAARLVAAVREADRVARMGGDEFAVLLTQDPAAADIDGVCRRIVAGLGASLAFDGAALRVGASIGVAVCPEHGATSERIYKAADLALYEAKHAGRNTWRWFSAAEEDARPTPAAGT